MSAQRILNKLLPLDMINSENKIEQQESISLIQSIFKVDDKETDSKLQ